MRKGIDCASTLSAAVITLFMNDGDTFFIRYLDENSWKGMKAAEAKAISAAGARIGSVFERAGDQASIVGQQGTLVGKLLYAWPKPWDSPKAVPFTLPSIMKLPLLIWTILQPTCTQRTASRQAIISGSMDRTM
jgi:hypothetical protein